MTPEEVRQFLETFKIKKGIWFVTYYNRAKNLQALADLGINALQRDKILDELQILDYSEGPLQDEMFGKRDMWVFGKLINGTEVYIKITMGDHNSPVICISFHPSEYRMNYPLKQQH